MLMSFFFFNEVLDCVEYHWSRSRDQDVHRGPSRDLLAVVQPVFVFVFCFLRA